MGKYNGRGWEKKYPDANGTFTDHDGHIWEVRKIDDGRRVIYMHWDIDGEHYSASFSDKDGTFGPLSKERLAEENKANEDLRAVLRLDCMLSDPQYAKYLIKYLEDCKRDEEKEIEQKKLNEYAYLHGGR
jgi:hypothetical protein